MGIEVSPLGVAAHFEDLLTGIILDKKDSILIDKLQASGLHATSMQTLMTTPEEKIALAEKILTWSESVTA